jgi:TRAP-type C4-dicarboxylate transport system permease small subunit
MALNEDTSVQAKNKLPQFTLRTMFLLITILGLSLAVLETIGMAASFGLLLAVVLVALHIIGNVLGTRLRDEASPNLSDFDYRNEDYPITYRATSLDTPHVVTGLNGHTRQGWVIYFAMFAGATTGCILGATFLLNSSNPSMRGLLVGAGSSGVVGALFGFLYGSFLKTWLSAWWQASAASDAPDKPSGTELVSSPASLAEYQVL